MLILCWGGKAQRNGLSLHAEGQNQEGFLEKRRLNGDLGPMAVSLGQTVAALGQGYREWQDPKSLPPHTLLSPWSYKGWDAFHPHTSRKACTPPSLSGFITTFCYVQAGAFRDGKLQEGGRLGGGRGRGEAWPHSWCVGVCMCEGLDGPSLWSGEDRTVLHGWHRASNCAMPQGTVQGLDGPPAGSECQLDAASEERHAGPAQSLGL